MIIISRLDVLNVTDTRPAKTTMQTEMVAICTPLRGSYVNTTRGNTKKMTVITPIIIREMMVEISAVF
jgi:hypothetical protein